MTLPVAGVHFLNLDGLKIEAPTLPHNWISDDLQVAEIDLEFFSPTLNRSIYYKNFNLGWSEWVQDRQPPAMVVQSYVYLI